MAAETAEKALSGQTWWEEERWHVIGYDIGSLRLDGQYVSIHRRIEAAMVTSIHRYFDRKPVDGINNFDTTSVSQ